MNPQESLKKDAFRKSMDVNKAGVTGNSHACFVAPSMGDNLVVKVHYGLSRRNR